MSLSYYGQLNKIHEAYPVKSVEVYGYDDAANYKDPTNDVFERAAISVEGKSYWLELNKFTLDELNQELLMFNIYLDTERRHWGIYNGDIAIPYLGLYIESLDRAETDIDTLITTTLNEQSEFADDSSPWWDSFCLAEHLNLTEESSEEEI